jgi:hypothetical protein
MNNVAEELRDPYGCRGHRCPGCGQPLIHRDNRQAYETSSAIADIIGREGPVNLAVTSLLASRKGLSNGKQLLRLIEHMQQTHRLEARSQWGTLSLFDDMCEHCVRCPDAAAIGLAARSGVLLINGLMTSDPNGDGAARFDGPQTVTRLRSDKRITLACPEDLFRLLDPEDLRRRQGIGWKRSGR